MAQRHPAGRPDTAAAAGFRLSAAQLVVARRYDFPSWARLRRYVEVVERYSRFPERMTPASPADEFLRLACLYYDDDQPGRWAQAHQILLASPEITQVSVYAAASADVPRLAAHLAGDPGAAARPGGPFRCEPLFYLAYARHDPAIGKTAVLTAARMLLEAGADPNAGYLWHGLPTPFTVLTGVFGEGEPGPVRQPRHPHSLALARLLLEAGASPNDGQALYNRMFEPGNDHLELPDLRPAERFVAAALGADRAAVAELRAAHPALLDAVRRARPALIVWGAAQGQPGSVELLAGLGFDVNAKGRSDVPAEEPWQTALHVAAMEGHLDLARSLLRLGADPDIRDQRFGSTSLGWARYFGQEPLITLLEPLTAPDEPSP